MPQAPNIEEQSRQKSLPLRHLFSSRKSQTINNKQSIECVRLSVLWGKRERRAEQDRGSGGHGVEVAVLKSVVSVATLFGEKLPS